MKINRYIVTSLVFLSSIGAFAFNAPKTYAYTTYKTVPKSIRGYYISKTARDSLAISKHYVKEGSPFADMYSYHVTKVNYSKKYYNIHSYIVLGNKAYFTLKFKHYAKNRLSSNGYSFQKVSKTTYRKFLNNWNYIRG